MIICLHERRKQKKKEGTKVCVSAVLFQSPSLKAVTMSGSPVFYLPLLLSAICCHSKPGISLVPLSRFLGNFPE